MHSQLIPVFFPFSFSSSLSTSSYDACGSFVFLSLSGALGRSIREIFAHHGMDLVANVAYLLTRPRTRFANINYLDVNRVSYPLGQKG